LCDSEAKMEATLSEMIYAAKKQQRRNILPHLEAPYSLLRSNRTKEMLDEAAKKIANNQPFAIKDELKKAMDILGAVKAGLLIAGEKVGDQEDRIALDTPLVAKKDFEAVKEVVETKVPDAGSAQEAGIASPDPRDLLKILPPGQDKLSILISQTGETARSAHSRTVYLSQARPTAEMPRCMNLNHARVREMQRGVSQALHQALAEADNPAIPRFLKEELVRDAESLKEIDSLLGAKDLSELTRQLQDDFIQNLDDLIQYIAFQKKVDESTAQNKKGGGEDEHHQKFLLRDKDLEAVEGAVRELKGISTLQKDVHRSVSRFSRINAQGPLQTGIEQANRERASLGQKKVAERMVSAVTARTAHLRAEAAPRVNESGLGALSSLELSPLSAEIAAGRQDAELARRLGETVKTMEGSLQTLLDVLEERVKVPVVRAPVSEETITQSDYERNNRPESLAERVRADPSLPPEIKEKMLQALSKGFPPKYKDLLTAYYLSCLQTEKKP
jgi:HPt (histidine-containing phosphotransfer) domain-containing protein